MPFLAYVLLALVGLPVLHALAGLLWERREERREKDSRFRCAFCGERLRHSLDCARIARRGQLVWPPPPPSRREGA